MQIIDTNVLIPQIIDKIMDFLSHDVGLRKDFFDFTQFEAKKLSQDEKRARTLMYLSSRRVSGKSIYDYYLSKNLNLVQKELVVVDALKNAFGGVFEVKKVYKDGFELYSIINEKIYEVNAMNTMIAFRGAYVGSYLYCCLCKIEGQFYVFDVRAITGADKVGGANRYAISKILENPDVVFFDNDEKLSEIKEQIGNFEKKFQECFNSNEVITTNKFADEIINSFNDYCETGNDEIKKIVEKGLAKPEKYSYFPTSDFNFTNENFAKKSIAGFSAQGSTYDVGIIFIEGSGLFAIPFFGTFCKIFERDDYKSVPNYDQCLKNFLNNDKISSIVLTYVAKKYPNFVDRVNEIEGFNLSFEQILRRFKPHNLGKPVIAPASILYSSKVFAQIMTKEVEKEEKESQPKIPKVGRNDPCPCGSGKKYKKCCMAKNEEIE